MKRAAGTPTAVRKVGISIRISKDRDDEVSTEIQEQACRAYCAQKGWEVVDVAIDRGRSGYKNHSRRAGLDRLFALLDSGHIDTIVVYRIDRLSRSVRDFVTRIWNRIERAGGAFASVSEQFGGETMTLDTTNPMGQAMLFIILVFAQLESGIKSQRTADWHAFRNAQQDGNGNHTALPAGRRMFGYTQDRKIIATEAKWLRRATKILLAGETLKPLQDEWQAAGLLTAHGSPFTKLALRQILMNPHVCALRDYGDGVLQPAPWKPIISVNEWEQVTALYDDPTRRTIGSNRGKYLLSGLLTCETCGAKMFAHNHSVSGLRYRCQNTACSYISIAAAVVDEVVIGALLDVLGASDLDAAMSAVDPADAVRSIESELVQLAKLKADDAIEFAEWQVLRTGITERLTAARELQQRPRPVGVDLGRFDDEPLTTKRMLITWAFARIGVLPASAARGAERVVLVPRNDDDALAA